MKLLLEEHFVEPVYCGHTCMHSQSALIEGGSFVYLPMQLRLSVAFRISILRDVLLEGL